MAYKVFRLFWLLIVLTISIVPATLGFLWWFIYTGFEFGFSLADSINNGDNKDEQ